MQSTDFHKLLDEQIRAVLGDAPEISSQLSDLLQRVSDTYGSFDAEQVRLADVADRRTQQLVASTSRAYSFLDSLHMGLILFDVKPTVVYMNNSARQLFSVGFPAGKPAGDDLTIETIANLLPQIELGKLVAQSLASAEPFERQRVDFGARVLRLFIAPMINEVSPGTMQHIGSVLLLEDITEQAVLERSKDEFFSIASHELRTPLTAIRGNSSLIKKYYGDKLPGNSVGEMVDDIHASAVRLIDIVNDFLDVSALEQGKMQTSAESFALVEVIGEVVRETNSLAAAKSIGVHVEDNVAEAPAVMADRRRIKQVVYNLIGNAIKFTDNGSITISASTNGALVQCNVTDTGSGMPVEGQRLLFRKFQQAGSSMLTRDATIGTGLGLYISKLIIEFSGGKIWLAGSTPGQGSTFAFTLPCA